MQPTGTTPFLKRMYPKIIGFLKSVHFFVSILLGVVTSWLIKGTITPLLFWGKSFDGRSSVYQLLLLAAYVFFTSIIFFWALVIISKLFPRQFKWGLQKLLVLYVNIKLLAMRLFHPIMAGLKYGYKEIVYTLQVISIKKEDIRSYLSSPYRIILIVIFTMLFLPHAFILVDNIKFITAYEVDAGEMMQAMAALFKNSYNMNTEFGTRFYGWPYFSINFILLIPIYIAMELGLIQDVFYLFVAMRLIFFVIGLGSTLAFYEVAQRVLRQGFFSFIATLLFIAAPLMFSYFYFIHPETTGLLFLFLGILSLFRFHEGQAKDYRWYTIGLVCLVLSALSKQIFFFTALPVLFLFLYFYCLHREISIFDFLKSQLFIIVFLKTTMLSLLVFFLVHPYAFLQPNQFMSSIKFLLSAHSSIPVQEALRLWALRIETFPLIFVSILTSPITLAVAFLHKGYKPNKILYIVNVFSSICILFLICANSRLFIYNSYLIPVYPFFILNVLIVLLYLIRDFNFFTLARLILIVPMFYFLFFILVEDISVSVPMGYTRFMYKDSTVYKIYLYIDNNIPENSKIANDHTVTVPDGKGITSCNYWGGGCGTDYIEEYNPDYVIFDQDYQLGGDGTIRLKKYVSDHNLKLIAVIDEKVEVYMKVK